MSKINNKPKWSLHIYPNGTQFGVEHDEEDVRLAVWAEDDTKIADITMDPMGALNMSQCLLDHAIMAIDEKAEEDE